MKNKLIHIKLKNIKMFFSPVKILLTLVIICLIVIACLLVKYQTFDLGMYTKKIITPTPTPTVTPTEIPTPSPTAIPTEIPTSTPMPTITPTPTPNPVIQSRINQIDNQIAGLHNAIKTLTNLEQQDMQAETEGCYTCASSLNQTSTFINSDNLQIQQLEAEETQLKIEQQK